MANTHNHFLAFKKNSSVLKSRKKKLIASRQGIEKKIMDYFNTKTKVKNPKFYIQGSSKMGNMVLHKDGTYDVDLGVYFLFKPQVEPKTLQSYVLKAVTGHTESGTEHREKCIRVIYKGDFDIDLPVYYKTENDAHPYLATKTNGWVKSDPKELCDWFENKKDSSGQLLRITKYLKAWANYRAKKMPSGIALTVWTARFYKNHSRDDIALFETLKAIKSDLWCGVECINPATPGDNLVSKLDESQKTHFKEAVKNFMNSAYDAINTDNIEKSCNIWRTHFGNRFPAE